MNHIVEHRRVGPCRRSEAARRGTTTVELALVLLTFLVLVFGMLDLGLGVLRYNTLSQAARQVARQAIVHGAMASRLGPWGPADYTGTGSDTNPIAQAAQSSLSGFDLSEVNVQVSWLDGDNKLDQTVRATVSAPYQPLVTFIFGNPTFTLQATSTMQIAH